MKTLNTNCGTSTELLTSSLQKGDGHESQEKTEELLLIGGY